MRRTNGDNGGEGNKRSSILSTRSLRNLSLTLSGKDNSPDRSGATPSPTTLQRKRNTLLSGSLPEETDYGNGNILPGLERRDSAPQPVRPSLLTKRGDRPVSLLGSWRSKKSSIDDDDAAFTTTSSLGSADGWADNEDSTLTEGKVLIHGDVQTGSGKFKKKKEYVVVTDTHLRRYRNRARAAEMHFAISSADPRLNRGHSSVPSSGSEKDLMSSTTGVDRENSIALSTVIAVHSSDDGQPFFTIEIDVLNEENNQSLSLSLQLDSPGERDAWLSVIRDAVEQKLQNITGSLHADNLRAVIRSLERDNDYDPTNCAVYKVVQRSAGKAGIRLSVSDDSNKLASTICFLAIGVHKFHFIMPSRSDRQKSTLPGMPEFGRFPAESHALTDLVRVWVSEYDDNLELVLRKPFNREFAVRLASSAAVEIALRLRYSDGWLRPEWTQRPCTYSLPPRFAKRFRQAAEETHDYQSDFDHSLVAYAVAYGFDPGIVRYSIDTVIEDAPSFILHPPDRPQAVPTYTQLELLAILRALRYNEYFKSISFAKNPLNSLLHAYDNGGTEHVVTRTKRGANLGIVEQELLTANVLVQEIRAIAVSNRRLRRMDFSGCIVPEESNFKSKKAVFDDEGCGVTEALFPLCKVQSTNVDWIALNHITLSDSDVDWLYDATTDRSSHLRAIELCHCGLGDRTLPLIMEALRAQAETLEFIDISENVGRIDPRGLNQSLELFSNIRVLNLANLRTSGDEALVSIETFLGWRLSELRLNSTRLNTASVDALAGYLSHTKSESLRELDLSLCSLTGGDVALLFTSMSRQPGVGRDMHVNVSRNDIGTDHRELAKAILKGFGPLRLTIRLLDYRDQAVFRELISALARNKSIKYLDMAQASLPDDASDETCKALEALFAENNTIELLDISGEESRLEHARLGDGISRALEGLARNTSLQTLSIQSQSLGLRGAQILADVLRRNNTLQAVYCSNNYIPLTGFTDLVNAMTKNRSILFLSDMEESKSQLLAKTERDLQTDMGKAEESQARSKRSSIVPSSWKRPLASPPAIATYSSNMRWSIVSALPRSTTTGAPRFSSTASDTSDTTVRSPPMGVHKALPSLTLSEKEIQGALQIIHDSWDKQQQRLSQYLDRNLQIARGEPITDIEEEDELPDPVPADNRPASIGGMQQILEQVKIDTTPTLERDIPVLSSPTSTTGAKTFAATPTSPLSMHSMPSMSVDT